MIVAWSLLIYVGYNVLTVEAVVDLKKEYTWTGPDGHKDKVTLNDFEIEDIPDTCDASEDYTRNEKLCDSLYKMEEESQKYAAEQEEIAAQEDVICDNEDASITNIKLCMSDEREQEVQEREESDREMYSSKTFKKLLESKGIDYDDYKNDKLSAEKQDELETEFREDKAYEYGEEINSKEQKQEEVIEDWGNTVSVSEDDGTFQRMQEHFEARAESNGYSTSTNDDDQQEIQEQQVEEGDEPEQEEEESNDDESEEDDSGGDDSSEESE